MIESWKRGGGLRRGDTTLIPNGIDIECFRPPSPERRRAAREAVEIAPDALVITTVAVLRQGKGVEPLLSAMQALVRESPSVQVLVVGAGPEGERLRSAAASLGDRVRFLGARSDVPDILAASDLFVLASEREALPTVILEAMATGLPVIASRVGGIPEALEDGACGLLVPAGEHSALSSALRELISNPELRHNLGTAARRRAESEYSLEAWRQRLLDWYLRLVDEPEPGRQEKSTRASDLSTQTGMGALGS